MQTAPPRTASGTRAWLPDAPIEKRQRSRSPAESASGVASSTSSSRRPNGTRLPAERADAKTRTCSNPRSARRSIVTVPTAPVAPTTPIRDSVIRCSELEPVVDGANCLLDRVRADDAGDPDRGCRDDLDVHAL